MTWPSNDYYVRQYVNDHLAYQHTCQVLQEQNNKNQKLLVRKSESDSDSDSDSLASDSQKYRDLEKYIFSKFKEDQAEKFTEPTSESTSLLSNNTKKNSLILRLRHIFFPCCCIQ